MIRSEPKYLVKDSIISRFESCLFEIDIPYDQVIGVLQIDIPYTLVKMNYVITHVLFGFRSSC